MTRFSLIPASYVFLFREWDGRTAVLLHLRQNTGYRVIADVPAAPW